MVQNAGKGIDGVAEKVGIDRCQPVVKRSGSVLRADLTAAAGKNRTGIQPLFHQHGTDAGLGIAGLDRPLDGGGTAPARQQRGMAVDTAIARHRQHIGGKQQTIGDDDKQVGIQRRQRRRVGVVLQAGRMPGFEAARGGMGGKRLRCLAHAAARPARRLCVDGEDVMRAGEPVQRRNGEIGAPHEHDTQARHGVSHGLMTRRTGEAPSAPCGRSCHASAATDDR